MGKNLSDLENRKTITMSQLQVSSIFFFLEEKSGLQSDLVFFDFYMLFAELLGGKLEINPAWMKSFCVCLLIWVLIRNLNRRSTAGKRIVWICQNYVDPTERNLEGNRQDIFSWMGHLRDITLCCSYGCMVLVAEGRRAMKI